MREEIEHVREGKHGARSAKQAIAIGLSKARRAGVKLKPPKKRRAPAVTRKRALDDARAGAKETQSRPSARRSKASLEALQDEGRAAASKTALARQAKRAARKRSSAERSAAARKAAATRKRK